MELFDRAALLAPALRTLLTDKVKVNLRYTETDITDGNVLFVV
jgi:hypothetical protein